MRGRHFSFIVALFCCLVEDVWCFCYNEGFTFDSAFKGEDINTYFDSFCKDRSDRTYSKTDQIKQCVSLSWDKNHLDILITITELSIPSEDLYFSLDACKYILTKVKQDLDDTRCTRGGQNLRFSYLAPAKRNVRRPFIDEGNQSISHGHGKGADEGISYRYHLEEHEETFDTNEEAGGEDTSDGHERGEDEDTWNGDLQRGDEYWSDEYIQGDVSGHGSTTTVISFIESSITSTISAFPNNATSFTASNTGRKKHKTKTITETTTGTIKTTETMTTTASITNTVITTGTTMQTITTFISTSSISTDSSGSTNVYFKGEVKMDPQASTCGWGP